MPVTVELHFEQVDESGSSPSAIRNYNVQGAASSAEARMAVLAEAPGTIDLYGTGVLFITRDSVRIEPASETLWSAEVRYGSVPQTNESTFSFDTGGGTQHITHSLATVARYAPSGKTAPDFKGAIGVTADSVEGVDIAVPVYQFAETHYLPDSAVTPAYKATLFWLTGKVCSAAFKGFAAGECLFLGAAGSKRGHGDWEIGFRFAACPNVTNLTIGDITGINKKGWEYLWVRYQDTEDTVAKALVKRAIAVYVEQVYPYGDLNGLGI